MEGERAVVLECRGLRKRFGERVAVDDVGFSIAPGETYGLLGPNGAGKTTTISMICGLLARDGGDVVVEGLPVDTRATEARASIGYVPQEIATYPDLTARENLRFFGKLYGLSGMKLERRCDEILEIVDLTERASDRTDQYSGGMRRRLNIGLGLLNRPKLLVLDEPTVGVDPQSRNAILGSVERFREQGMAVLYTTHYMEEAERLCDRVGILDLGKVLAEGTRRELVSMVGEHDRVSLAASGEPAAAAAEAERLEPVLKATAREGGIDLLVSNAAKALPEILRTVNEAGAEVSAVEVTEPNLEAVFLHLTGKALRD
ncbi:MAG TPA: ABC transporter ATP-binding protein [Actinomycetota bacterium]|nr:ABC transporter ATP-binding protein [Actinomycetota bacterium]